VISQYFKYSINLIRLYGFRFFLKKLIRKLFSLLRYYTKRADPEKKLQFNTHFLKLVNDPGPREFKRDTKVDIIIPVYNAFDATAKCLASVLANSSNCRLIIIDDASTDQKIKAHLDSLANIPEKELELFVRVNSENCGFVESVNRAFTQVENHFVILNSDTEVPPGWLDRLFYPIIRDENTIASATPFSNAAMICSFPETSRDNPLFKDMSVTELDSYFRQSGSDQLIELPTGVGFCMAFNQKVVDQIGLFDAATFGKGYGEENDWCVRARATGYRNIMVNNLFVYHLHGASYSESEKQDLTEANLRNLIKKHPQYLFEVEKFIKEDPVRDIRDSIAVLADTQSRGSKKLLAVIDNNLGGGANAYSQHLIRGLREKKCGILHVKFNYHQNCLKFIYEGDAIERKEFIFASRGVDDFAQILALFKPDSLLINELVSWPDPIGVTEQIINLNVPYVTVLHDYFYICPNWNLINQHETFCSLPADLTTCSTCLTKNTNTDAYAIYSDSFTDISLWQEKMLRFLKQAAQAVCFSENSAALLTKAYPDLANIRVIEHGIIHPEFFTWQKRLLGTQNLSIGIIGEIGFHKGVAIIKKLIERPEYKKLPVNIVVLGNTLLWPEDYATAGNKFKVHGIYDRQDLPGLLEKYHVSAILIPSICPETFSFTTSEALLLGYPVICFDIGASADRVRKYQCGILADSISEDALLKTIKTIIERPEIIGELSENSAKYQPASSQEHLQKMLYLVTQTQN